MSKQYFIILIKRKKYKKLSSCRIFDIVVVKKHILSKKVLEKLGSYDLKSEKLNLNFFRLIYWWQFSIGCCKNFTKLLTKFNLYSKLPIKKN
jgi:hypothetical protein